MKVDSLINYIGHKSKIIDQISPYLPREVKGIFYDVFAGSCVVGLSVPYSNICCVDSNIHLMDMYRNIGIHSKEFQNEKDWLIEHYSLTNSSIKPRREYLDDPNIGSVMWHGKKIKNLHLDQLNKKGFNRMLADFNSGSFSAVRKSSAYMLLNLYGRNSYVNVDKNGHLSGAVGPLDYSKRADEKLRNHIEILESARHCFQHASYQSCNINENDLCTWTLLILLQVIVIQGGVRMMRDSY